MSFKNYLAARKSTADPEGDLARLASAESFPEISTVEDLEAYVTARYGPGSLSDAVPKLWKAYEAWAKTRRGA